VAIEEIVIMNIKQQNTLNNSTTVAMDPSKTDAREEDYFLGKATRMVSSISANNNSALDNSTQVRITEVAPRGNSIIGSSVSESDNRWKISIDKFSSKKRRKNSLTEIKSKRIKSYYKAQTELIETFEDIQMEVDDAIENSNIHNDLLNKSSIMAKVSFVVNLCLLIAKVIAVVESGSISVVSSLVDSVVDLTSGVVIWWSTRAMKTRNRYEYPQGKTKLEPIAIVILSVVMSVASLLLIKESITKIVVFSQDPDAPKPNYDVVTIVITVATVLIKLVLFLLCRKVKTPLCEALATDHRNDVLSNTVVIICGFIGSEQMYEKSGVLGLEYVDPIGAILISIYIAYSWWETGYEQITLLTGHTAKPEFLNKLTWLALNHNKEIKYIDTVRAFHFGTNFLVELDIVLPEDMNLKDAHDIGEALQQKLEKFPEVERAFVHLDYEFEHHPNIEHKVV
jgi:cation diffusion facilitator family transporter